MSSCKDKPAYCQTPYQVKEIKLLPRQSFRNGREVIIKNPGLLKYISSQLCEIKDVSWATGTRGERKSVEIKFTPANPQKIFVVERGLDDNDYRLREGTTYFRNDTLCKLVFHLVNTRDVNDSIPFIIN